MIGWPVLAGHVIIKEILVTYLFAKFRGQQSYTWKHYNVPLLLLVDLWSIGQCSPTFHLIHFFADVYVILFSFILLLVSLWQSDVVVRLGSKHPVLETLKALLDRAAPLLVDEHCIKALFKLVKDAIEGLADDEDDEYEWHESSGIKPVGKKGLALLLVRHVVF